MEGDNLMPISGKGTFIHNFDLKKLIEFAETAKGDVYLKTSEGDVLNLKSKLTQLLALTSTIDWANVGKAEIICSDLDDEARLFRMNLYGGDGEK